MAVEAVPRRIAKVDQTRFVNETWTRYVTCIPIHDLAWAAGIVDGEGCIFARCAKAGRNGRINPSYGVGLKVTMGHRATVDKIASMFGHGSRHEVKQNGYNDAWTWLVQATRMWPVLLALRPYLITKAEEADLALEFLALPNFTGRTVPAEIWEERDRLFNLLRDARPRNRL